MEKEEIGSISGNISRRGLVKAGVGAAAAAAAAMGASQVKAFAAEGSQAADKAAAGEAPRYVFLFIGDGMGNEQVQAASFYQGVEQTGTLTQIPTSFQNFPHVGSVTTYDSTSFCPDSASTATSIATGHKTLSGVINRDPETLQESYETIAEKLHTQRGYRIGILTSVNMNHATPAAFYAHQDSRHNYYEIGEELATSGFEFFAGGSFLAPTGDDEDKKDLADVIAEAGYKVVKTQADAEGLKAGDSERTLILSEVEADGGAMDYDLDAVDGEWHLADYVDKGIEMLGDDEPFFMMVEGGKIDWACHANDARSSIGDVLALDAAVQRAVAFAEEHPDETLILVTADHETGGLAIGYATTNYDTHLHNLTHQTISYAKFDSDVVSAYKDGGVKFSNALADVKKYFGLLTESDADEENPGTGELGDTTDENLVLTDYEIALLEDAFDRQMAQGGSSQADMTQAEYELYGTYQPFSMTVCHILDHKSGLSHTTYAHTGAPVNIYATGVGADKFVGAYDNTEIYTRLAALTDVQ